MGIKNIYKLIQSKWSEHVETVPFEYLADKTVAIDFKIYLYKYSYGNIAGNAVKQFGYLFQDLIRLRCKVWIVVDGNSSYLKGDTHKVREHAKNKMKAELYAKNHFLSSNPSLENIQEFYPRVEQLERNCIDPTEKDIQTILSSLRSLGCTIVYAKSEAEAAASKLNRLGIVDVVLSEDSDTFIFGCNRLLRGIGSKSNRNQPLTLYHFDKIREKSKLSLMQWVDAAILIGTDFNLNIDKKTPKSEAKKIYGIGPAKAYDLIQKYQTIENTPEYKSNTYPVFNQLVPVVRNEFIPYIEQDDDITFYTVETNVPMTSDGMPGYDPICPF